MPDPEKSRRRPAGKKQPPPPKPRKSAMSEPKATSSDVFEIDRIRRLVELMKEHDLSEVDLREARQRIRICRGPKEGPRPAPPPPPPAMAMSPGSAPAAGGSAAAKAPAEPANITLIKSPMVGTFYGRPNPKAEPYVKVGDRVDTATTVCIIEAMKVFNEIPAEVRGKIVAILCEDGEAVEFDKPLFKVDTSG
jgi:acetyl-CoA carboxylase biotin carboxyl carrier protein